MCEGSQRGFAPASAGEALAAVAAGLAFLNQADPAELTTDEQADCLRALERASGAVTAARSRVLAAFTRDGHSGDGQYSPRAWLRWQTQVTGAAATEAVTWVKRLAEHPAVEVALAAGEVSVSWAREICAWTSRLPATHRRDGDVILLAAVAAGHRGWS